MKTKIFYLLMALLITSCSTKSPIDPRTAVGKTSAVKTTVTQPSVQTLYHLSSAPVSGFLTNVSAWVQTSPDLVTWTNWLVITNAVIVTNQGPQLFFRGWAKCSVAWAHESNVSYELGVGMSPTNYTLFYETTNTVLTIGLPYLTNYVAVRAISLFAPPKQVSAWSSEIWIAASLTNSFLNGTNASVIIPVLTLSKQ